MEETNSTDRIALLGDIFADLKDKGYEYETIRNVLDEVYQPE